MIYLMGEAVVLVDGNLETGKAEILTKSGEQMAVQLAYLRADGGLNEIAAEIDRAKEGA